jgi:hypothetical protein
VGERKGGWNAPPRNGSYRAGGLTGITDIAGQCALPRCEQVAEQSRPVMRLVCGREASPFQLPTLPLALSVTNREALTTERR